MSAKKESIVDSIARGLESIFASPSYYPNQDAGKSAPRFRRADAELQDMAGAGQPKKDNTAPKNGK